MSELAVANADNLPVLPGWVDDTTMLAEASVPVLAWQPCADPDQRGFDCATAPVPLDYGDPQGATLDLAVIRHPATDPAQRLGALFWNPGGPVGSGTALLPVALALFPAPLRARLLTVDGYGHGILRHPSACASAYESRYVVDGTLPPPATVCPQDQPPFTTGP